MSARGLRIFGAEEYMPEITKVRCRWKMPLKIHGKFPVEIRWKVTIYVQPARAGVAAPDPWTRAWVGAEEGCDASVFISMYVCMDGWMDLCMYVCYVCMYVM